MIVSTLNKHPSRPIKVLQTAIHEHPPKHMQPTPKKYSPISTDKNGMLNLARL